MKQTFNIPDGCSTVTVEQVGNQLITTFEPEKYVPKVGDCVKITYEDGDFFFLRISRVDGCNLYVENVRISKKGVIFKSGHSSFYKSIEKITPEQFQSEFEKLGYIYDFETNTASKFKWRAKLEEKYFFVTQCFSVNWYLNSFNSEDNSLYLSGNYFQTEQQAQAAADFLKQQLKEFNNK